jgi:hypothetical protein
MKTDTGNEDKKALTFWQVILWHIVCPVVISLLIFVILTNLVSIIFTLVGI